MRATKLLTIIEVRNHLLAMGLYPSRHTPGASSNQLDTSLPTTILGQYVKIKSVYAFLKYDYLNICMPIVRCSHPYRTQREENLKQEA